MITESLEPAICLHDFPKNSGENFQIVLGCSDGSSQLRPALVAKSFKRAPVGPQFFCTTFLPYAMTAGRCPAVKRAGKWPV
jgi:hypothetical protein